MSRELSRDPDALSFLHSTDTGDRRTPDVFMRSSLSSGTSHDRQRRETAARFAAIAQVSGQIIWLADANGEAHDMPLWCAFTGQDSAGTQWLDALHPNDRERVATAWREAIRTPQPCEISYRLRRNDGIYRHMMMRVAPVIIDEMIQEWVGTCTDITSHPEEATGHTAHDTVAPITAVSIDQQQQIAALTQQLHEQQEAAHRMDDFLNIVSHELRTPLTSMKASVQLSERRLRTFLKNTVTLAPEAVTRLEQTAEMLERADGQVNRLTRMVGDLLETSRIQAGKLDLQFDTFDLVSQVTQVIVEQQAAWPNRAMQLTTSSNAAIMVRGDAGRIKQAFESYVINALRYAPAEATITISVTMDDHMARVSVRDQGPGIAADEQQRIWERFYRVPDAREHNGSGVGLGLGLFICRTIIERHDGTVGVESALNQGATFWLMIPRG